MIRCLFFADGTLLAGAGIPLIGVLNSGMGRSIGNPFAATTVMFSIAMAVALGIILPLLLRAICSRQYSARRRSELCGVYSDCSACDFRWDQFGLFDLERRPLDP
jgi:hypothetical protein